jgi:hypothetical protein
LILFNPIGPKGAVSSYTGAAGVSIGKWQSWRRRWMAGKNAKTEKSFEHGGNGF